MLFYVLGGLIGVIFFKKKYNLTFWQAVWNGIILAFVLYFVGSIIVGILSFLVGLDAIPLWAILLYALIAFGGISKLGKLKKYKTNNLLNKETSSPKQYYKNSESITKPKPGDIIETSVAGVTFEGRQEIIQNLRIGELIKLRREIHNLYDTNAIKVISENGSHIGYINRKLAEKITSIMDYEIKTKELAGEIISIYKLQNDHSIVGVKIKFSLVNQG